MQICIYFPPWIWIRERKMYNKKHRKNAWKLLLIVYRYLLKIEGQKLFKMDLLVKGGRIEGKTLRIRDQFQVGFSPTVIELLLYMT